MGFVQVHSPASVCVGVCRDIMEIRGRLGASEAISSSVLYWDEGMYTSADDTWELSILCVHLISDTPSFLSSMSVCASVRLCLLVGRRVQSYNNLTTMFLQANCSAVVKQLIKICSLHIRHTICFAFFPLWGARFALSRELLLSKCKTFGYVNREMNNKYVRCNMKRCSDHSICAQVWYRWFCKQASFVFYYISAF